MAAIPDPSNQEFSETTLKGFLLQNVDRKTNNPAVITLNNLLIKRVDDFWTHIVIPLKTKKRFDGNKIQWYFSIYREGLEARKSLKTPFIFLNVTRTDIEKIVQMYDGKSLSEYLQMGTTFLSSTLSLLTNWLRDQLMIKRLEKIYIGDDPVQWIINAEHEENGVMAEKGDVIPELNNIINNIQLIMSRRY